MLEINFGHQAKIVRIINSCTTLEQIESVMIWLSSLNVNRFKSSSKHFHAKDEMYSFAKLKRDSLLPPRYASIAYPLESIQYIAPGLAITDC